MPLEIAGILVVNVLDGGYDLLTDAGVAKNNIVVAAVNQVSLIIQDLLVWYHVGISVLGGQQMMEE